MKLLHTSDWHVGKTLKGRSRLDEQRAVLAEIVALAKEHGVDAVLIAGDLYESVAPSADAQRLVVRTLLQLARAGIEVIAIAGNHDHGATFEAYRPLMGAAGIRLFGQVRSADSGGAHRFTARSTGEEAVVAVLPFLSQRYAVRAAELIAHTPAENVGAYDQLIRDVLGNLTGPFGAGQGGDQTVNLTMAHLTCTGGVFGGGERAAQSIMEYHVPGAVFGVDTHYVALGHLHRRQRIPAPAPVHYSGSPLAIDFGEQANTNVVCLVEVTPDTPAKVTDLPIGSGRRLRTVTGTVEQLLADPDSYGEDYLRVWVRQAQYAGMREDLLDALPNALEIRIDPQFAADLHPGTDRRLRAAKTPAELFADYCAGVGVSDDRVARLFDQLHDELSGRT
ncbi:exonuclease SbcCD subunit D [Microlunatus ginsengisoli]|uniref:Nuclease SbcCD subunit D n=1 Tax=Microlunatus ginsengisoli TaxID=363863 RepID=A0ABP6ZXF8_9ACTN